MAIASDNGRSADRENAADPMTEGTTWLLDRCPSWDGAQKMIVPAHRRIGQPSIVYDRLFLDEDQETARATKLRTIGDVSPRR
jgi:hypothetical protein